MSVRVVAAATAAETEKRSFSREDTTCGQDYDLLEVGPRVDDGEGWHAAVSYSPDSTERDADPFFK